MIKRPRRLRGSVMLRDMCAQTRLTKDALIYPLFVQEGENLREEIAALPSQYRTSPDRLSEEIDRALQSGVRRFMLFGIPNQKDEYGSQAYNENGVVQQALRILRKRYGDEVYLITDVCMCEYTSHGHCGIITNGEADNDATLPYLARIALSHVRAGADMVAPSDMMDGRVAAIRTALDQNGYCAAPILSYAAKYASYFYGPFREAAGSAPQFGDRRGYQMDARNQKEAVKEALTDEEEGADILMVKPALAYGDVIAAVARNTMLPVAAYSVSGEYAMIKCAAAAGLIDETGAVTEACVSAFRAGAQIYLTYYAKELARIIAEGRYG